MEVAACVDRLARTAGHALVEATSARSGSRRDVRVHDLSARTCPAVAPDDERTTERPVHPVGRRGDHAEHGRNLLMAEPSSGQTRDRDHFAWLLRRRSRAGAAHSAQVRASPPPPSRLAIRGHHHEGMDHLGHLPAPACLTRSRRCSSSSFRGREVPWADAPARRHRWNPARCLADRATIGREPRPPFGPNDHWRGSF